MKTHKLIALLSALVIIVAYSNHFDNGFEFDDTHTIVNNEYIRDIKNVPLFFTDIKYYGTNPGNQSYNPVLVTLNTIDYWLGGGLNPVAYHLHIFFWYLIQLILMYVLYKRLLSYAVPETQVPILSILLTAFYGIHTAHAETINYIIMRSDSFSAMCMVAGMVIYQAPMGRKYYLYLVPVLIGMMTKEVAVMFAPLLFFYILLYEEEVSLGELITLKKRSKVIQTLKKAWPALLFCFGFFYWMRVTFMPAEVKLFMPAHTASPWQYFYTQWVVITHYIGNFILPLDLSADPDFEIFPSIWNRKVIFAFLFLFSLVILMFYTSKDRKTKPISYGLLWYFITLAPTSSIIPFGQTANDHRMFLPDIGLMLAVGHGLFLLYGYFRDRLKVHHRIITTGLIAIFMLHAYGTYQRNEIWGDSEKLWKDVTEKSPNNGRGLMNYGLLLMAKGQYAEAEYYFTKTLEKLPYWAYIHINMGILKNAQGYPQLAEQYFNNAIRYQPDVPDGYYYYAEFLVKQKRYSEAEQWISKGLEKSPGYVKLRQLAGQLDQIRMQEQEQEKQLIQREQLLRQNPSVEGWIELGLIYYRKKNYHKCIEFHLEALKLDSNNAVIYNNICSAYNEMQEYRKAIEYCRKALLLDPSMERAKNNLNWALSNLPSN